MTAKQGYPYQINGKTASTDDQTPTSAQVLADAGFEPAEDFVLIKRTEHGTSVVSSDDVLDLTVSKEFFAFEAGAIFELTVNEHSIYWGSSKIDIKEIRRLGNVSNDDDLIWIRIDEENEVLALHGHFFVDTVEYSTEKQELTGAQIMAKIPDWNPANSLVLEGDEAEPDEVIHPTTVVVFKGRETPAHFAIVPPATFGML